MSFGHLLTQTITVAVPTGVTSTGSPVYGAAATIRARVEFGTKVLYGSDGTQRQCAAVIVTESALPMDARIWLPGDDVTKASAAKRPLDMRSAAPPWGGPTLYETYL